MKVFKTIWTCLLLLLTLLHCDKDELTELEKLPPATHSGLYTFGCLVDGKAWVTEWTGDAPTYYQTGTLFIYAGNRILKSFIGIHIYDLNLGEREYQLTESIHIYDNDAFYNDVSMVCEYFTTKTYKGSVTITHLDKSKFIVSGTFEFEAWSADCNKVVKITDGRFDLHYAP